MIHETEKDVITIKAPKLCRFLAALCASLLLFSSGSARAEFSPRLSALSPENGYHLDISVSLESMNNVTDSTLALLQETLPRLVFSFGVRQNAQITQSLAEIRWNETDSLLSIYTQEQPDFTLTSFSPSGQSYLTAPSRPDALALLAGEEESFPLILNLPDLYARWAPSLYPLLSEYTEGKKSKTTTSIKNAAASAAFINYTLDEETMNAAWPRILDTLLPLLQDSLEAQPAEYQKIKAMLSSLQFSGSCRFKRFLDKQDGDMGLQFTGNAGLGEDVRKVTLFGGYTPDKGGFVSLALPAVKGKDNFKISFTGKLTSKETKKEIQKTLTLEGSYTRTLDGKTDAFSLTGNLKNIIQHDSKDEAWSGKITMDAKQGNQKSTWTLTPEIKAHDSMLSGGIRAQKKEGNTQILKGALDIVLYYGAQMPKDNPGSALDLRLMTDAQAKAAVQGEATALFRALLSWLDTLPKETRALFTHDLRTDDWMNGPTVPPAPEPSAEDVPRPGEENYESPWIVEEE